MSLLIGQADGLLMPCDSRRRFLGWAAGMAGLVTLPACQPPRLPMRVGSLVFPGYEFLFLARELGFLDSSLIKLVEMRANTETLRALASDQLEAAALTVDELMSARAEGVDMVVLAILDASVGADAVLARPGVKLESLKGKRIGVEDGAVGGVMLAALLEAANLSPQSIQKVSVDLPSSETAYEKGEVDVVIAAEPWVSRMEQKGAVRIFDSKRIPNRIFDVLAVRRPVIETYGDALNRLVRGHFEAQAYFRAQPLEAAALMAPRLGVSASEVGGLFKGLLLPNATENRALLEPRGAFDAMTRDLQKFMTESGLMRQTVPLTDFVDTRFLPV